MQEARWYYDPCYAALRRTKSGEVPPGVVLEIDISIPSHEIPGLIEAMEEANLMKPRLDERLRTEDLKITHRLMDLLDKSISK